MGRVDFDFIEPGDPIQAATLNQPFDAAATESAGLDHENIASEGIGAWNLDGSSVVDVFEAIENTSSASVVAVGNVAIPINHSGTALEYLPGGGLALNEGDVLRVEWMQRIHRWFKNPAVAVVIGDYTIIKPQWDIGAGYVDAGVTVGAGAWINEAVARAGHSIPHANAFAEQQERLVSGSSIYEVGLGGVTITGIRLVSIPSPNAMDGVFFRAGALNVIVYRR